MSRQMDACLEKEQIGTLFVGWGHRKGGLGGGVRGVKPKNRTCHCLPKNNSGASCRQYFFFASGMKEKRILL